jgi:hypothetical protein
MGRFGGGCGTDVMVEVPGSGPPAAIAGGFHRVRMLHTYEVAMVGIPAHWLVAVVGIAGWIGFAGWLLAP